MMGSSQIPGFYKLSPQQRVRAAHAHGLLSAADFQLLREGGHTLSLSRADKMIENVIGVMGLPVGLGLNFLINDKEYAVPMVVEEPSVVAALSAAAKLVRGCGGFRAHCDPQLLIGQIQVVGLDNLAAAREALMEQRQEILNLANSLHPRMVARGGGVRDLEVHLHAECERNRAMLAVHLLVDTRDAMGANLVNTQCEGVAGLIEKITGGRVFLRIISNLTDRARVRAEVAIPPSQLATTSFSGEQVRDSIIIASEFAAADPYRAATHNKGIMNGIDAVALATGNDWRALEAGAHAFAARHGQYGPLSQWCDNSRGELVGRIEIPAKVGMVGGPLQSNPTVAVNMRLLGVKSATELACVIASVGLAQNLAALKALSTEGIQRGHMMLHARSVALAAGTPADRFDQVVAQLIDSGDIKIERAREILAAGSAATTPAVTSPKRQRGSSPAPQSTGYRFSHGKLILFGEHAVVYGRHALAVPIRDAVRARITPRQEGIRLLIPRWNVQQPLLQNPDNPQSYERPIGQILQQLGLRGRAMEIEVHTELPRAMGLGGSAAAAVAIIRALDHHFRLKLNDQTINELAFETEKVAHGTPSGVDNAVACCGHPLLFRPGDPPLVREITLPQPFHLVVGMSGIESLTAPMVTRVRSAWEDQRTLYEHLFDEMDSLSLQALGALKSGDLARTGELMNIAHGLLNALQVSCPEIEELISIARDHGALGAKLTGAGGGGSMIALCPTDDAADSGAMVAAMQDAGYQTLEVQIDASRP